MANYPEEYLKSIITKVAKSCKLENYDYTVNNFDIIGQNYFGVLIPIILTGSCDNKQTEFHIVLKLAPTDERYRVSGALTLFFAREIFVYSTLFKSFKHLNSGCNQLIFPKCYYIETEYCKEALVIEDMRHKGFRLYTDTYLDYDHTLASILELSKLHALSFILRIKEPVFFEEVVKFCAPLNPASNKRFMDILEDRLDKALVELKDTKYVSLLKDLRLNYERYIDRMVTDVSGTAVCHGDIWKENILFSYQPGSSIQACLIDYQTARISSPAFDILFLLMTSTNTHMRQNYDKIIKTYYDNFSLMLTESNLELDSVYSFKEFCGDLKVCVFASFIIANTAIWLSSGMQQEGHVRSQFVTKTDEDRTRAKKTYINRVTAILEDFFRIGYWAF